MKHPACPVSEEGEEKGNRLGKNEWWVKYNVCYPRRKETLWRAGCTGSTAPVPTRQSGTGRLYLPIILPPTCSVVHLSIILHPANVVSLRQSLASLALRVHLYSFSYAILLMWYTANRYTNQAKDLHILKCTFITKTKIAILPSEFDLFKASNNVILSLLCYYKLTDPVLTSIAETLFPWLQGLPNKYTFIYFLNPIF